jgi:hypothetical protein
MDQILNVAASLDCVAAGATDDDATAFLGKRFDRMPLDFPPRLGA